MEVFKCKNRGKKTQHLNHSHGQNIHVLTWHIEILHDAPIPDLGGGFEIIKQRRDLDYQKKAPENQWSMVYTVE